MLHFIRSSFLLLVSSTLSISAGDQYQEFRVYCVDKHGGKDYPCFFWLTTKELRDQALVNKSIEDMSTGLLKQKLADEGKTSYIGTFKTAQLYFVKEFLPSGRSPKVIRKESEFDRTCFNPDKFNAKIHSIKAVIQRIEE